jgi:hypothetical protein
MMNTKTSAEPGTAQASRQWQTMPFTITKINKNWPLGNVRCVGRLNDSGNCEYLVNVKWWSDNKANARRYTICGAKMIAKKYGGIVLSYYRDNSGNYYLMPDEVIK